jgi:hypothetical protein
LSSVYHAKDSVFWRNTKIGYYLLIEKGVMTKKKTTTPSRVGCLTKETAKVEDLYGGKKKIVPVELSQSVPKGVC